MKLKIEKLTIVYKNPIIFEIDYLRQKSDKIC